MAGIVRAMTATLVPYTEPELTAPIALCNADGTLNRAAVGWSRHPLHDCNLPASLPRKKKWNYWAVTSDDLLFSATIADMERAIVAGAYLFDRHTKLHIDKGTRGLAGSVTMPQGILGDIEVNQPDFRVALTDVGSGTRISVAADSFGGMPLRADIVVQRPAGHETLNVVIPWSDRQFQFTSKQNTLPASGYIELGEKRYELGEGAFGCLDYGRGVWPEHTVWNWGAGSGVQDGRTIGLNLGDKWTDGTGMNENGLCIDGRLTKISEDLVLDYDRDDWMKPWRVRTSASDRIDLHFEPDYERAGETGRRDSYYTEVHQMFGRYSGRITPDGEGPIEVRDLFGWIEEHDARW